MRFKSFAMVSAAIFVAIVGFSVPRLPSASAGTTLSPPGFPYGSTTDTNPEGPQKGCFTTKICQTQFKITTTNSNGSTSTIYIRTPLNIDQDLAITSTKTLSGGYTDSGQYCGYYYVAMGGKQVEMFCGYDKPQSPCS
jgi:hypothetical protein